MANTYIERDVDRYFCIATLVWHDTVIAKIEEKHQHQSRVKNYYEIKSALASLPPPPLQKNIILNNTSYTDVTLYIV